LDIVFPIRSERGELFVARYAADDFGGGCSIIR